MIKFVFLDIDDTIFDFFWAERKGIFEAYSANGFSLTEENFSLYHDINSSCWKMMERGEMTREQVLTERHAIFLRSLGLEADPQRIEASYRAALACGYRFMPYMEELLPYLKKKYRLYIVSNGLVSTQYTRLESAGIRELFDDIFISEELHAAKPTCEFFDAAFRRIPGFRKEEAVIIGDSIGSDVRGGMNAGIRTIFYNYRNYSLPEGIVPDITIHSLSELYQIL